MKYNFLNIFLDKKDLFNQEKFSVNKFLLENNYAQIEKIYNFYKETSNLLHVSGFLGAGKTQIVNYTAGFLSAETVLLRYFCSESAILDDILLSFFAEFRRLAGRNIIIEPKTKTDNFAEKINLYFSQIEKPFVIILDSFDSLLPENKQEILDFIVHLCKFNKVKVVIIAKTFEHKYFDNSFVTIEKVTLNALSLNLFEKYLKSEDIKLSPKILEKFYRYTRGYMFFTSLVINLMKTKTLEPLEFLRKFTESFLTFDEFLSLQSLELISPNAGNLFWFLSMLRHPVNLDLLKILDIYDEEKMENLKNSRILIQNNSSIYIHEFFKDRIYIEIPGNISQKLHRYIIDIYETQLPLKPLERNILISRQTMRKEINYHEVFLPGKIKLPDEQNVDINYLSYAKGLEVDLNLSDSSDKPQTTPGLHFDEPDTEVEIKTFNPSAKDNKIPAPRHNRQRESQKISDEKNLTVSELITNIKEAKTAYDYTSVIDFCKKFLLQKKSPAYEKNLPFVYMELAFAYQKMADTENALKYFNLAEETFSREGKTEQASEIKLKIAKIFSENYKTEQAKFVLEDILKFKDSPKILKIKALIQLAVIEDNLSNDQNAFNYYKEALKISKGISEEKTLLELYLKFGIFLDDKNETALAREYYLKCIELAEINNNDKFVSLAYSNLADLYLEQDNSKSALENYLKSFEINKTNNNYEGMYHSSSKLASILRIRNSQEALEYLKIALESAVFLNDSFYTASANLALGDFFYDALNNEMAIKHYVQTLREVENEPDRENFNKVQKRLKDVKTRLGEEKFIEFLNRFNNERF